MMAYTLTRGHYNSHQSILDAIGRCPKDETSLVFGVDILLEESSEEVIALMRAIPEGISSIDLSSNSLYRHNKHNLARIFCAIPEHVSSIGLRDNSFDRLAQCEIDQITLTIPSISNEFAEAVFAIPKHVLSIDLRHNNLGNIQMYQLVNTLKAFPVTLKLVNLSYNSFLVQSAQALEQIKAALSPHIQLNFILDCYLEKRTSVRGFNGEPLEYFYFNLSSFFQRTFGLHQKREAIEALKSALMGNFDVDLLPHIDVLENGTLGLDLQRFIGLDKAREIIPEPRIATVREFMIALRSSLLLARERAAMVVTI